MGCVYKATCLITGKIYIGITKFSMEYRKSQHKRNTRTGNKFRNHYLKYGFENLIWEILLESDNYDFLKQKEIQFISQFDSFHTGLNSTFGGDGTFGYVPRYTQEWKEKIRASVVQAFKNNPEIREKRNFQSSERNKTQEARAKNKEGLKRFHESHPEAAIEQRQKSRTKKKIAILFQNGSFYIFDSIRSASSVLGISRPYLSSMINGRSPLRKDILSISPCLE